MGFCEFEIAGTGDILFCFIIFCLFLYVEGGGQGQQKQNKKAHCSAGPWKVQIYEPKDWDKCLDNSLLKHFKS